MRTPAAAQTHAVTPTMVGCWDVCGMRPRIRRGWERRPETAAPAGRLGCCRACHMRGASAHLRFCGTCQTQHRAGSASRERMDATTQSCPRQLIYQPEQLQSQWGVWKPMWRATESTLSVAATKALAPLQQRPLLVKLLCRAADGKLHVMPQRLYRRLSTWRRRRHWLRASACRQFRLQHLLGARHLPRERTRGHRPSRRMPAPKIHRSSMEHHL